MTIREFPPVDMANEDGLLAIGGDLEKESLLLAYRSGIFPWPLHQKLLAWFAPPRRALLFLDRVHVSRSTLKFMRKSHYHFSFDRRFGEVIGSCAELINRGEQGGTWITPGIVTAYTALHQSGICHSVECWDGDQLVGGLYGISIGKMFAGESMFYRKRNASKLALLHLCEYLRGRGVPWIDCQVMTPLVEHLGAVELSRDEFMRLLHEAVSANVRLFD